MSTTPPSAARLLAPRLLRSAGVAPTELLESCAPRDLLSRFDESSRLTAKVSSGGRNRFFMYEEHGPVKLQDDKITPKVNVSPKELAGMLEGRRGSGGEHCYWTSPVAAAAPDLLEEFEWHEGLHGDRDGSSLDPRGPSLWMGTSGSGTQCHYDVTDNAIVQLHGTKRVRCFPPNAGVYSLHVFPDAHPRARKSQVDFDAGIREGEEGLSRRRRYPHYFENVPKPILDVVLRPGDALEIPAFWFHHVENGLVPNSGPDQDSGEDGPSVSLNIFALSGLVARGIFQKASRPLGRVVVGDRLAPFILGALGTALIRGLDVTDAGEEGEFIRRYLLDARYRPLGRGGDEGVREVTGNDDNARQTPTEDQMKAIEACVDGLLPDFRTLLEGGGDGTGIALLSALHLLELWAVELVGASSVEKAWSIGILGR